MLLRLAKRLSRQPLFFQLFVRFRENRPTKDYSCKISDGNSNSKCHLITDYEMVALPPPPIIDHYRPASSPRLKDCKVDVPKYMAIEVLCAGRFLCMGELHTHIRYFLALCVQKLSKSAEKRHKMAVLCFIGQTEFI